MGCRFDFDDFVHCNAAMSCVPLDVASLQCEEGVIDASSNVLACMELGSTLAHKNVAGQNEFAVILLYTETLGAAVVAVLAGALSFFMGHCCKLVGC